MGSDIKLKSRSSEITIASLLSFVLAVAFMFESPLNPFMRYMMVDLDSAVVRTVGYMMHRGYMPYRDTFDHKGPLIYILNYVGDYVISDKFGLWLIEVISLAVSVLFFYLASRLICNRSKAFIVALTTFSVLLLYFYPGNFVEEFAVPFIAVSNYIFIDYLVNSNLGAKRIIVCGSCLGVVLMLKPNMIPLWIVFCIVILVRNLISKQFKELFRCIFLFLIGVVLVVLPIILWLYANHSLTAFWNDYIVFNFGYTSVGFSDRLRTFKFFIANPVILISLISIGLIAVLRKDKTAGIVFVYVFMSLVLASISGIVLEHYGLILIPSAVYPLSRLFNEIGSIKRDKVRIWVDQSIVLFFFFASIFPAWISVLIQVYSTYEKGDFYIDIYDKDTFNSIVRIIDEETTRDEKIAVFGNWDSIYLSSDRVHATTYSYQDPPCYSNPERMQEYLSQLEEEKPRLIIVQAGHYHQIGPFLESNGYELLWPEEIEPGTYPAEVYELN